MPDLHGWITQQINDAEAAARAPRHPSTHWDYDHMCGEIRDRANAGTVAFLGKDDPAGVHIAMHDPAAVLRRCEADRRTLARHALDPDAVWYEAAMCKGCGTYGDMDSPVTENLNDCPELIDLAHAHGLTAEILAGLDRPQDGERPEPGPSFRIGPPARPASSVPPALRGLNWRAP